MVRNATRHGVAEKFDNKTKNRVRHKLIKKFIALSLLPYDKIVEGFVLLKQEAIEKQSDRANKCEKFCKYFENEWLKKVTPESFSVFNALDRTNNYIESWHRRLNRFEFISKIPQHFNEKFSC